MASNLLDTIRGNRAALAGTQAETTDETARAASLLRAKTGKAVATPGDAVASNLGEQSAVADTQAQLGIVGQQIGQQQVAGDIQQKQLELQDASQKAQTAQARKFQTVETKLKTNQLLSDLSRDRGTLDLEKDKARLEQTTFLMSMQDKQYVDKLQDIGKKRRLDNSASFAAEMEQIALGSKLALLKDKLAGKDVLSASDRDFAEAMSRLKVEDAYRIAQLDAADLEKTAALDMDTARSTGKIDALTSGVQAQAQGLSGLVKGGLEAGNSYVTAAEKADAKKKEELDKMGKGGTLSASNYGTYEKGSS